MSYLYPPEGTGFGLIYDVFTQDVDFLLSNSFLWVFFLSSLLLPMVLPEVYSSLFVWLYLLCILVLYIAPCLCLPIY